jgi:glycosyltransferase involved in cell wall biosynthesis
MNEMMTQLIVHLTTVHAPFDTRIFHKECRTLADAGYHVVLVGTHTQREIVDGVELVPVPRYSCRPVRMLLGTWAAFRIAWRLHPDVVHFHDPELLLLVPLLRLTLGRRVKLVYDIHEYFIDSLAVKHWIPPRLRPLAGLVAGRLERLLIRGMDGLVFAVEGQKSLYEDFRGVTTVVRNMPVAQRFEGKDAQPDLEVTGFKLVYVGLILPQRGIDVLLEAMWVLRQRGVEDIYLFLIGPATSAAYIHQIQAFAQAHQLDARIRWLGYVPYDELKNYLGNADVGLAPGLLTQQYSRPNIATKLFEYMLCGLPIITVDNPHWCAYVEQAQCGLVVPVGDASAFAEAILWLRDHPDEAQAMGQRGRVMVRDLYTWEQEKSRLLDFYQTLFSQGAQ